VDVFWKSRIQMPFYILSRVSQNIPAGNLTGFKETRDGATDVHSPLPKKRDIGTCF
jgi:hypothetical protein